MCDGLSHILKRARSILGRGFFPDSINRSPSRHCSEERTPFVDLVIFGVFVCLQQNLLATVQSIFTMVKQAKNCLPKHCFMLGYNFQPVGNWWSDCASPLQLHLIEIPIHCFDTYSVVTTTREITGARSVPPFSNAQAVLSSHGLHFRSYSGSNRFSKNGYRAKSSAAVPLLAANWSKIGLSLGAADGVAASQFCILTGAKKKP